MAGIYIHVPFCKQACRYCDFYFSVSLKYKAPYLSAVKKEIAERKEYAGREPLDTIYFGGGTPSLLTAEELGSILESIKNNHSVSDGPEITLEANPDDLTSSFLEEIRGIGFNRLSIGVQSFKRNALNLMRRSHNEDEAVESIKRSAEAGFQNINMDLIYGIPGMELADWRSNLQTTFSLPITHLSAYHLTFEPGTIFDHWRKKGRIKEVDEEESLEQYYLLRQAASEAGFTHYEISNFAKEGAISRHNSAYWNGTKYIGIGPAAHSYNGLERRWNVASLLKYSEAIHAGSNPSEFEIPDSREQYHDYIITALRTAAGADIDKIERVFGKEIKNHFLKQSDRYIDRGELIMSESTIKIDPGSWLTSDHLLKGLML